MRLHLVGSRLVVSRPYLSPVQSIFYRLYFILVQLTLLCLVVFVSTVSARVLCSFVLFSLHYVSGINKVMMMMMMMMMMMICLSGVCLTITIYSGSAAVPEVCALLSTVLVSL